MDGLPIGAVVDGRWRVTGTLGSGGFGHVLLVDDISPVGLGAAALKVVRGGTSPLERASFLREVQKIAKLRHQNLVGYVDSGLAETGGGEVRPYVVTELCERSLDDALAASPGGILPADAAHARTGRHGDRPRPPPRPRADPP